MSPALLKIMIVLKKVAIVLAIFLTTLLLAGIILFAMYRNSLQQAIISEINKHLEAEVQTGKIKISVLAHFPMVSVKLRDIRIKEPQDRTRGIDLLQADELSLQFNLIGFLHKEYTLQEVKITRARINLVIFEDGSDNFHFWKESSTASNGNVEFELREVILQMVDITWQNLQKQEAFTFTATDVRLTGNFSDKKYELGIKGDIFIALVQIDSRDYVKDKSITAEFSIDVDNQDMTYHVKEGTISTGQISLHLQGTVSSAPGGITDLILTSKAAPLAEYLALVPPGYSELPKNVTAEGDVATSMTIKGKLDGNIFPDLNAEFSMDKGIIRILDPDMILDHVKLAGSYSIQSTAGNGMKDELSIRRIKASLGEGVIEGSIKITDLSRPFINLTADMNLKLQDLVELLPAESIREIAGLMKMHVNLKGPLSSLQTMDLKDILLCKIQGEMTLRADQLLFKNSAINYHDIQADIKFDDRHLNFQSLTGKSGTGDFSLRGIFLNFLPWLLAPDETLRIDADLHSNLLNLDEILQQSPENKAIEYHFHIPEKINLNLDISLNKFIFREFSATGLKTNMTLLDQQVTFHDLIFTSMEGNVSADCSLKCERDDHYSLTCNARLKHVNIRQLFHDMENFGQTDLTDQQLRGYMDAEVYYSSSLTSDLTIAPKSIYALGRVNVGSGELIGYTPLYKLSGFLNIDDLKHIRFSELNNLIEISHQTIIIPEMEIKSNTLDLNLYGTHTFDNEIDYHFSLLLSQLLSVKFKSPPQDEFGIVEDDGLGRTKLYISLSGTVDDPTISYDRIALKEKLSGDLKKERMEIRKALQNEFIDSTPSYQQQNKIKGPKFKINWEDNDTIPDPGE